MTQSHQLPDDESLALKTRHTCVMPHGNFVCISDDVFKVQLMFILFSLTAKTSPKVIYPT